MNDTSEEITSLDISQIEACLDMSVTEEEDYDTRHESEILA